ncbi:MAG: molybdopterin-dependent oxidoreductase [Anaerolineaceae bacterium]|nr:molybdopterin-dependent oxidoreductase [Anaerolineaceae bacterium]
MPHPITRRNFLKVGALGAASAILAGCQNPRRWVILEPYIRPPEEQIAGKATWYASTCRMCPAGCGIIVRIMNGRALKIEGNPDHPLNRGKLCPRGQAGLQLLYNPDRLTGPVQQAKRGSRQFQPLQWNEAINKLSGLVNAAGNGLAIWLGSTTSGHLIELFTRFAKATGAPAPVIYDLYSALSGYPVLEANSQQLFNTQHLPSYPIGDADVVFSFGANLFGAFTSTTRYGIEYGRFRSHSQGERGFLVQFEAKMTNTGVKADRWVAIQPGYEGLVAQAIARIIADQALGPAERVGRAGRLAGKVDTNLAAKACNMSFDELAHLARVFATAVNPVAIPGGSLGGQPGATDAVNAVQILNLIIGNIGQPGGMIAPTTNQAAGFAETGITSYKDVQELISRMQTGQVKVLLVSGVNPVYELPAKTGIADAIAKVPSVVSFAPIVDETALQADLILPDRIYLEAWGYGLANPNFGQPIINSQQPVVMPLYDSRSTADVLLTVAKSVTGAGSSFSWNDEVAFIKETVAQLPIAQSESGGASAQFARFLQHGGWWPGVTNTGTGQQAAAGVPGQGTPPQYQGNESEFPYFLDIYLSPLLSDGRGASIPWLQGVPDPVTTMAWQTWVELNPATAAKLGIKDGDELKVTSPHGEITGFAYTIRGIRPDTVSIPTGQGHTDYGRYARDRGSNPMSLVGAEATTGGENLVWSNIRVKLAKTGKHTNLATFEYKPGVDQGFINKEMPGR